MTRWGLAIDLRQCIGCKSCSAACREANSVHDKRLRPVHDCGLGQRRERLFLPVSCMHCAHAPCHEVCPTGATFKDASGVVLIDEQRCIGCGYCIVACPYRARLLIEEPVIPGDPCRKSDSRDRQGICVKCNFCLPKIAQGIAAGLTPAVHPEATPCCVVTCTAGALHFGDLEDPHSPVARFLADGHSLYRLQEDLHTDPAVFYAVPESWRGMIIVNGGRR